MRAHDGDDVDDSMTRMRRASPSVRRFACAPQARPRTPHRFDMVGAPRPRVVGCDPVHDRVGVFCDRSAARVISRRSASRPTPRRSSSVRLFFTSAALCQYIEVVVAPVVPGAPPRRRPLGMEFRRDRLVGGGSAARRHAVVQRHDLQRAAHQPRRRASKALHLDAGRDRVDLLPHRQPARVRRGGASLVLVDAEATVVAYHSAQPCSARSFSASRRSRRSSCRRPVEPISLRWTNLGTFIGAVCFLVGAVLLLPERMHPDE